MADLQQKIRDLVRKEAEGRGAGFESLAEMPEGSIVEPYYPCLHIDKAVKGLDQVGKEANVTIRARVKSIRQEAGEDHPEVDLEVMAIKTGVSPSGFQESDKPVTIAKNGSQNVYAEGDEGWEGE